MLVEITRNWMGEKTPFKIDIDWHDCGKVCGSADICHLCQEHEVIKAQKPDYPYEGPYIGGDYLRSEYWYETRQLVIQRYPICANRECKQHSLSLDVHHRTYRGLQRELLCDLVAVCRTCHKMLDTLKQSGIEY